MRFGRQVLSAVSAGVLLVPIGGVLAGGEVLALAPTCQDVPLDQTFSTQDIDNDIKTDVIVGVPSGAGVVDVRLSRGGTQHVGQSFFSGLPAAGATDRFGSAVEVLSFSGDRCMDVAIGAPGSAGRGAVDLVRGSVTGLDSHGALQLKGLQSGEHFGAALASIGSHLWVGAPDRTVSGKARAGAIDHYRLSGSSAPVLVETITENSRGVAGVAEAGDRFGSVLSVLATRAGLRLAVGEPQEDVGRKADAGSVAVLRFSTGTVRVASSRVIAQGVGRSSGVAEKGDRFGAAVAMLGDRIAVGSPGEDLGSKRDAGQVQTYVGLSGTKALKLERTITQNSPYVPDRVEAGDQFGASLVAAMVIKCETEDDLVVGSPGEDIGTARDAGSVTLVALNRTNSNHVPQALCRRAYYQGTGRLGGTAESGDRLGATLALLPPTWDSSNAPDEQGEQSVLVGVPGEDLGAIRDAGSVVNMFGSGTRSTSFGNTTGRHTGERYGAVMARSDF